MNGETVVVPVEPTREMWAAGADAVYGQRKKPRVHHDKLVGDVWRAMVAAREAYVGYCRPCGTARKAAPCQKCGGELAALLADHEEPRLPDVARIRALAREVGYAIGVHGTMERDLDLIAVAWAEEAVAPAELAAHLAAGLNAHILNDKIQDKPLGRWSCSIQIDGWFKVIDLSVAPSVAAPRPSAHGALGFGYGECGDCLEDGSCTMNCTSAAARP